MLRQTRCFEVYPNKSILEDLVTREGPATKDSFTPFEGKADEIQNQFKGTLKAKFKLGEFIKYSLATYGDLNPSKVKDLQTFGMLQEAKAGTFMTLEDLISNGAEHAKVREYVMNMCVGYKKNSKSPIVENHEIYTRTVRNYDGDGEAEEEKFLQVRCDDNMSNADFEKIVSELPYIMKSIWSYSKSLKANLFSFIFAYMDIKAKDRRRTYVTVTDFMFYPTFLIKPDGTYVRNFVHSNDNKYIIYPQVTKIFISPEEHKAEFNLCVKFMNYLTMLGIDYRDEDPYEYNNEFINSIVCSYLPNNDQYFNEYKDVDIEIKVALSPENIFNTTKSSMYVNTFNDNVDFDYSRSAYFVSERIKLAYRMGELDDDFLLENKDEALNFLELILCIQAKKNVELPRQLVSFEASGLMHFKKEIFALDGKYFGTYHGRSDYRVALTKYGFLVVLEEEYDDVFYLKYEDCIEALKEYKAYGKVQSEACWKRLGVDS